MGINFSNLPQENPFAVPPPGIYKFKVLKAEMKPNKDPAKKPYLRMQLSLSTPSGKKVGSIFDNITESTSPYVLYKLQRFTRALKLNLQGEVELRDLAKLIPNREGVIEISNEQDNRFPDDPSRKQAQPRMFGSEIFWTTEELPELLTDADSEPDAAPADTDEGLPFVQFSEADGEVPPANEY